MNKTQLDNYRNQLQESLNELTKLSLGGVEITTPGKVDHTEIAQATLGQALAIANLGRDRAKQRLIVEALNRTKTGTYGFCVECDEEISLRRLDAVPWTPLCFDCQQKKDANNLPVRLAGDLGLGIEAN